MGSPPAPPAAPVSGDSDPYGWIRDRDLPAMRLYFQRGQPAVVRLKLTGAGRLISSP